MFMDYAYHRFPLRCFRVEPAHSLVLLVFDSLILYYSLVLIFVCCRNRWRAYHKPIHMGARRDHEPSCREFPASGHRITRLKMPNAEMTAEQVILEVRRRYRICNRFFTIGACIWALGMLGLRADPARDLVWSCLRRPRDLLCRSWTDRGH